MGAQLFCSLLRCAGVEARLVASLQPLACVPGAPAMPNPRNRTSSKKSRADQYKAAMALYEAKQVESSSASTGVPSPRRRLGHPNAAAYSVPAVTPIPTTRTPDDDQRPKTVRGESTFPVYWVEVLDVAHQKWQPVDALVTHTHWKPKALEPPASDRGNCLSYVVAFEDDGVAKDVTRRYVKAYNSKTRRMRVDGLNMPSSAGSAGGAGGTDSGLRGERWWRRVMRVYARPWPTDLDQIEDNELRAEEAREPMPRSVADFKDHPIYALERHLRRHEVLVPGAQPAGTVAAGNRGPLERIYRRRDVRIARSADKWYRLGREVRFGEEHVKILPKPVRRKSTFYDDDDDDDDDERRNGDTTTVDLFGDEIAGTPIYTFEQTEQYQPPPVVNGKVPKNKFGNVDVYVPSMVPQGGTHLMHERAAQAAFILGVDYAPALTGFQFRGRHGTAVLSGVVVPTESKEAVQAAIEGLADLDAEIEQEKRTAQILRMWSRFLKGLRIRERIWAGVDPDDEEPLSTDKGKGLALDEDVEIDDAPSDVSEEYFMEEDEAGGGFLIE